MLCCPHQKIETGDNMTNCKYCGTALPENSRLNTEYCNDDHRTKYNNDKRKARSLYLKALKAINELQAMSESGVHCEDAKTYLRRMVIVIIENDELAKPVV
jgi:hypothetical protein